MGYFDLPTGEFELLLKKRGRGQHKEEWKSVMFTDGLRLEDVASCAEEWSKNYNVLGARYCGRKITIPTGYHWELRYKDNVYGVFKTRAEAAQMMQERKERNWAEKIKENRVPVGIPVFVKD